MSGYSQFCPIALASEVFAERWTPLILRELLLGRHRFNELQQGVGGISQSLLVQRLHTLEAAGVIERAPNPAGRGSEYHLTPAGAELESVIDPLAAWSQRWLELREDCLNAAALVRAIHMALRADQLPHGRTLVRFDFTDPDQRSYWILLERPAAEVCYHDPGGAIDLVVSADVDALTRVYLGRLPLGSAIRSRRIALDGARPLVRGFPRWLGLNPYAQHAKGRWTARSA